jgi:aspartyl-tRNA(Asn)/glutamyl-tRNA(Gln) amidotransferase subunit A
MTKLNELKISEALDGMAKGDFTSVELTQDCITAMEQTKELNAFIVETPDKAREMAAASDARRAKGEAGVMEGIPIGMKDLFCTQGTQTTAASHILEGFVPQYESTVSQNLWNAGSVMLGKLNLDEFAMGSANITSHFGNVVNPWQRNNGSNAKMVPGGSSGGSAASVAANSVMGATGTDTGGSIRQPAAFCGITGIKPTYGRCSRWGIVAFASSLDQAGPMARSVRDCAIMLEAMAGYDKKDSTSINRLVPSYQNEMTGSIKGKRIGVPKEYRVDGTSDEITKLWEQGIEWMRDAGAEIVDISLPHTKYALPAYYIVAPAEASSNLARYDGIRYGHRVEGEDLNDLYRKTRADGFGDEVQRRIMIGAYVLSAGFYDAYYNKARQVRTLIANDFKAAFGQVDAILTPTAPTAAFGDNEIQDDPIAMYLNDVFTVPASLAGLPAMSVPAGLSDDGLPLGLHLIGQPFEEGELLNIGGVLEKAAAFSAKPQLRAGA